MKQGNIVLRTTLKPTDPADVDSIVRSTRFFRPDEIKVAVELVEETLEKGDESGYSFVFAEVDGRVAGYSCFGLIPCSLISWDLYWIATGKEFQNMGIGKMILKKTEEIISRAGGRTVYIETSSKPLYEPTREFYLRNGCTLKVVMEDFYETGDHKHVYIKRL